jgi:drug/metabolite transporter superfamily protein YnfA
METVMDARTWIGVAISGIVGGMLTSQIGSGADITWFVLGSIFLNARRSKKTQFSGNALTAVSVIIMATASCFGTVLRISTTGENAPVEKVYQALLACSWIVVVGAPMGSLFLTPYMQDTLKRLFYVLSFVQLIIFGVLKISDNGKAWGGVVGTLGGTMILVVLHYTLIAKKKIVEAGQKSAAFAASTNSNNGKVPIATAEEEDEEMDA